MGVAARVMLGGAARVMLGVAARVVFSLPMAATLALGLAPATAHAQRPYDIVIRGGTVVDGTGGPRFRADIGIKGDRIVRVDSAGLHDTLGMRVIDARGLIIAPGFIDSHAHVATQLPTTPLAENFVRQGITSIMASLHSQDQPWPMDTYVAAFRAAPNVGLFAGHSWIRKRVMGLVNRPPTPTELAHMEALVDSTMRQGALGLASGLEYIPANYAATEELIALAKVAARYGGIYITHMRDEGPGLLTAVRETIRIAREGGLPAQINHHKASGAAQFGWSTRSLALIDSARALGLDITHDVYPYTAFSTISDILFPQWALADGPHALAARLADPTTRQRIVVDMRRIFHEQAGTDLTSVQFRTLRMDRRFDGKTLADYVRANGKSATLDHGIDAIITLQLAGGFEGIFHAMSERDVQRLILHPWAMIETDGDLVGYGRGYPHPRSYGAFPRVIARYVREQKLLTLESAIARMTSRPARQIGQVERGVLRAGMLADVVVFDFERIRDVATYTDPHHFAVGIVHLLVNGRPVIADGSLTGAMPGRVLRGPARPDALRP